jgi:hypothetical protein
MCSLTFDLEKKSCIRVKVIHLFGQKKRIFNSFNKANSELLNYFLAFSAGYHNLKRKKKSEKSGIRTRVAWAIESDHTTPESHM